MALRPDDPDVWVKYAAEVTRMERWFLTMCIIVVVVIGLAAVLTLLAPPTQPAAPSGLEFQPHAQR